MLTHKYQNWYTELVGLSDWQWYGFLAIAMLLAGLSVVRPQFFQILAASAGKRVWRGLMGLLRSKKAASKRGIYLVGERFPDNARVRHTHIVGSPGSGKTVLLEQLVYEDLARGYGMLIIDPKGDRKLYERVRDYCRAIGRERHLHYLSASRPEESVRWNPCSLGDASELQSKWFNSGVYREPFYAKACELALLEAFNALLDDKKYFTLRDLVEQLKIQSGDGPHGIKDKNVQGLFLELQAFAKSEWGPIMGMPQGVTTATGPVISLLDIRLRNEILYVDLPIQSKALQSTRVGKLLLQEIVMLSGLLQLHPELRTTCPFSVFVDEFGSFATENFASFLSMGRGSDFMIHIAHQTLADLERVSKPFKDLVMGISNNRFIFRQDNPKDAEEWAKFLGTKTVTRSTYRTSSGIQTGESSNRSSEEFLVHPNEIKTLKIGHCVFSMKTEGVLKRLRLPFPPKQPKRSGGVIEREVPREEGVCDTPSKQRKDFDRATDEQANVLESARKRNAIQTPTYDFGNMPLAKGDQHEYNHNCD